MRNEKNRGGATQLELRCLKNYLNAYISISLNSESENKGCIKNFNSNIQENKKNFLYHKFAIYKLF